MVIEVPGGILSGNQFSRYGSCCIYCNTAENMEGAYATF